MVEEQIQKLKTLQESFDALSQGSTSIESKVDEVKEAVSNIDLSPIESKVDEGVETLSSKIDNIKLPEIDTTELASKDLERFFGITAATEYTPLTEEEITNEINTLWEGL